MRSWRVEGEEVPEKAPDGTDGAGRIEDRSPSKMRDDESAQWIGYANAEAEPWI